MLRRLCLVLVLSTLVGCSGVGKSLLKGALGGGGPNVNAQVGKENTQQVILGTQVRGTQNNERVKAEIVETVIVNERTPPWVILLLLLGWFLPTPNQIVKSLISLPRKLMRKK